RWFVETRLVLARDAYHWGSARSKLILVSPAIWPTPPDSPGTIELQCIGDRLAFVKSGRSRLDHYGAGSTRGKSLHCEGGEAADTLIGSLHNQTMETLMGLR